MNIHRIFGAAVAGLLALAAAQSASADPPANAVHGKALFSAQCSMCHSTSAGVEGAAPSLAGVVGRKAAAEIEKLKKKMAQDFFGGLKKDEAETLIKLLRKAGANAENG